MRLGLLHLETHRYFCCCVYIQEKSSINPSFDWCFTLWVTTRKIKASLLLWAFFSFFLRNPWFQLKGNIFLKVKEHGLYCQSQLSGRVVVSSHVLFLRNLVISGFKEIAIHSLKTWVMSSKINLLSAELPSWRPGYSFLKQKLNLQFKIYKDSFVLCTYSCMTLNTIMN